MYGEQPPGSLVPLTLSSAVVELDQSLPGWNLAAPDEHSASQPRTFSIPVTFDTPFANTPLVHAGITGFDIDNTDTARLSVRVADITTEGFALAVTTWLYTRVYKVDVSWIALGHQRTD